MTTKILLGVVATLVVAAGVYWLSASVANAPAPSPEGYSWRMEDKTSDQSQPKTAVSLVMQGKARYVGTYDGSCAEQETDLLPNEESKVVCWFAGGGKEIGLFNEAGKRSVKVGDLDEGSAEVEGFRGNFQTAFSL